MKIFLRDLILWIYFNNGQLKNFLIVRLCPATSPLIMRVCTEKHSVATSIYCPFYGDFRFIEIPLYMHCCEFSLPLLKMCSLLRRVHTPKGSYRSSVNNTELTKFYFFLIRTPWLQSDNFKEMYRITKRMSLTSNCQYHFVSCRMRY